MGCTVELVDHRRVRAVPGLGGGELDATLEVWPSVHAEDYAQYIEDERRRRRRR